MCGRYAVVINSQLSELYFGITEKDIEFTHYNIAPGSEIPALIYKDEKKIWQFMRWSLIPFWSKTKKIPYTTFNIKQEGIWRKPVSRKPILTSRCVIPATAYYEWEKSGTSSIPYCIKPLDFPYFLMGGIWDIWNDKNTGEIIFSCAMITRPSSPLLQGIHHRMPLIIEEKKLDLWLNPHTPKTIIQDMMDQPEVSLRLDFFRISPKVGNSKINDPSFIRHENE